jgi:hypothetical protein
MGMGWKFQHESGKRAKGCPVGVACEQVQEYPQRAPDEITYNYFLE